MTPPGFNWRLALAAGSLVIVLDQWSKQAISAAFKYGETFAVTSFFNLVLVYNKGAAFSFLSDASGWQREFFIGITLIATVAMFWMMRRYRAERLFCWGLALICAGAIGNLIDRISHGHVIDFLDFHFFGWHFWAFNLADSAITLGAACLIVDSLFRHEASPA